MRQNMSRVLRSFLFLILGSSLIAGCDVFGSDDTEVVNVTKQILITSQGNFSDENGTLSLYSLEDSTIDNSIIAGFSGLPQSVTLDGSMAYVMVNTNTFNGGRIDVVDLASNTRVGQIPDVAAPRYMAIGPDNKAYVSNLFDGTVSVIDMTDNTVMTTLAVGANPEGVLYKEGKIFVANYGFGSDSTLTVIDPSQNIVIATVDLECDGPRTLLDLLGADEFVVICSGNTLYDADFNVIGRTDGQILFVSPKDYSVATRINNLDTQLGAASFGQDAAIGGGKAFVVRDEEGEILVLDIATRRLTSIIDVPDKISAVQVAQNELYVGTYTDFTTAGKLRVFSFSGVEQFSRDTGVVPSNIQLVAAR